MHSFSKYNDESSILSTSSTCLASTQYAWSISLHTGKAIVEALDSIMLPKATNLSVDYGSEFTVGPWIAG